MASEETALSFMKHVTAGHRVAKANKDMARTVVGIDLDLTDYSLQWQSNSVGEPPSNAKSESKQAVADLSIVTKSNVEDIEEIVKNYLSKWPNTLETQSVKAVESTFDGAIQTIYFNSNVSLMYSIFHVIKQALDEVVGSNRVLQYPSPKYKALPRPKREQTLLFSQGCPARDSSFRSHRSFERRWTDLSINSTYATWKNHRQQYLTTSSPKSDLHRFRRAHKNYCPTLRHTRTTIGAVLVAVPHPTQPLKISVPGSFYSIPHTNFDKSSEAESSPTQ